MSNRVYAVSTIAGAAFAACAFVLVVDRTTAPVAIGILASFLTLIVFSIWPWSILPITILGSTSGAVLAGSRSATGVVIAHLVPLAGGALALLIRRGVGLEPDRPPSRLYRSDVTLLVSATLAAALFGLSQANTPKNVAVATYHVGVIPLYLVVAMYTLNTPERRRRAFVMYVVLIVGLTLPFLVTPGRHGGGLLSLLPLPILMTIAGRERGWKRFGLACISALLIADLVLADYRSVWLATAVCFLLLAVRGRRAVRQGLVATVVAGIAGFGVITLVAGSKGGLYGRFSGVADALSRSAGYRAPEANVGLRVFASHPFFGAGLGQTTPHVYIENFAITDVGPVYHSFYVLLLANVGLVGCCIVLYPVVRAAWKGLAGRDPVSVGFAALTVGFLFAAAAAAPTDGHWELGLLPALTLLTLPANQAADQTATDSRRDRNRGSPSLATGTSR